jgi:hypothetical protein
LISPASGTREIRKCKFEPLTHEVTISKNERRRRKFKSLLLVVWERKGARLDV